MGEEEEVLDPRIEVKLEELNQWTIKINHLEKLFEERNSTFRIVLNESSDKLKALSSKLGKCVDESRPFYEAKEKMVEAQMMCQKAALNYEKSCQAFREAKEIITSTEKRFASTNDFDPHWQEKLNQANIRLMETEKMKKDNELSHHRSMKQFLAAEKRVHQLEKQLRSRIQKSKVYFDEQQSFQKSLSTIKNEIEKLNNEIEASKNGYSEALKKLESISEEIHEKRNSLMKLSKREPGVGAERNNYQENPREYIYQISEISISEHYLDNPKNLIESTKCSTIDCDTQCNL